MTEPTPQSGPPEPRRSGFQIGRVFGFPLRLSGSWLLMAVVITVWYGEVLGARLDLHGPARFLAGLGFVACLLLSVLLHELGHAVTARRNGIGVKGITLDLLGGYTEFEHDSPRAGVEFTTAIAGPVVSALVGVGAFAAALVLPDGTVADQIAIQLAVCNVIVAVYNALPGWPLDGGRALRALVWAARGNRDAGLLVAGWSGRVVALLTVAVSALLFLTGGYDAWGLAFGLFVAYSIWQGAAGAVLTARVRKRYPLVDPTALARPLYAVPAGTSLAEADRRAGAEGRAACLLGVTDPDGRLIALVVPDAAAAVPPARRPWVTVETVARDITAVARIPAAARGADVIKLLRGDPAAPYLVVNGEDVVGVLTAMDVVQVLDPATLKAAPAKQTGI